MAFEASSRVLLLFSWWDASTSVQYGICCLCCIVFGFISIALKVLRRMSEMRLLQKEEEGRSAIMLGSFPLLHNAIRGSVAFLNYAWDYMLMLVAMTFNVGIFLSMLGGMALGFLAVGHLLDFTPEAPKVSNECKCDAKISCGCHRGQPCTCYGTCRLVKQGDPNIKDGQLLTEQPGVCRSKGSCGKAVCGV
ncbi:ctr copper transporter domain-containing protein [Cyclospora cayetanensis]|nr:ctr copper transporter domain-containing protein [Cyclospora cayetanensis]